MRQFWKKRRPRPEEVHRMNEAVSPKDAYRVFAETVRKYDYFKSWKKSGPKRFKEIRPDFVRAIDLVYADKWSKVVGLCATLNIRVAVKSDITKSFFCVSAERDRDVLIYNFVLEPGVGLGISASIDDAWRIAEKGLDIFAKSLHRSLESDVVPWLEQCTDAESLLEWMELNTPGSARWPLMLTVGKKPEVRRELRALIDLVPEHRMRETEIDWYSETGVLSEAETIELRSANMQIEETYRQRMKALARDMNVAR